MSGPSNYKPPPKPRPKSGLKDQDLADWQAYLADKVEPLPGRRLGDTPPEIKAAKPPRPKVRDRLSELEPQAQPVRARQIMMGEVVASPSIPPMTAGAAPGLDNRTRQKLRRGKVDLDGLLDLHGMTRDEAFRALSRFLAASRQGGRRAVLIITGRGLRRDGSIGVIRQAVPDWLNAEPNRAHVLAFDVAQPKDGGDGALYVLLRKPAGGRPGGRPGDRPGNRP